MRTAAWEDAFCDGRIGRADGIVQHVLARFHLGFRDIVISKSLRSLRHFKNSIVFIGRLVWAWRWPLMPPATLQSKVDFLSRSEAYPTSWIA